MQQCELAWKQLEADASAEHAACVVAASPDEEQLARWHRK